MEADGAGHEGVPLALPHPHEGQGLRQAGDGVPGLPGRRLPAGLDGRGEDEQAGGGSEGLRPGAAAGGGREGGDPIQALQQHFGPEPRDLPRRPGKGNHHESECWINTLYDNYGQTLLRPEKKKNLITRQKILKVLGRTEEDIKEGLTVQEVLPFFREYKLKLRVYDVFYNLIHKYDPEVPNFNHRPMFCVTDGDHIYTLNKDPVSYTHLTLPTKA